jgi:hypothetical protein
MEELSQPLSLELPRAELPDSPLLNHSNHLPIQRTHNNRPQVFDRQGIWNLIKIQTLKGHCLVQARQYQHFEKKMWVRLVGATNAFAIFL